MSLSTPKTETSNRATERAMPAWRKNRMRLDGMSLSIEMAASVVLGWYLGKLFDDYFGTQPWGMLFFLLAGLVAAGKAVARFHAQAKRIMAQKEPGREVADSLENDAQGLPGAAGVHRGS